MICCDRCEEWFHGDCVGITEARGRLMERNGEDYICPNCTAKKNQLVKPATTAVDMENSKPKADALAHPTALVASAAALAESRIADLSPSASPSVASSTPAGTEEKAVDDPGIKGRIEKAINPTGKKRIKIFQPVCPFDFVGRVFITFSFVKMLFLKCSHQIFVHAAVLENT